MQSQSRSALRRSFRNQKKQTRLEFSPLPSSSPSKEKDSQAVHDRLANVRYHGCKTNSPGRRDSLPTPELSSETIPPASSPSLPAMNTYTREDSESDDDDDDLVLPSSKRRRIHSSTQHSAPQSTPSRRSTRLRTRSFASTQRPSSSRSDSSQTSVEIPLSNPSQTGRLSDIGSAETSGDENEIMASKPTRRRRSTITVTKDPFIAQDDEVMYVSDDPPSRKKSPKRRQRTSENFIVQDDEVEYITSSADDDMQNPPLAKVRKNTAPSKSPRTPHNKTRREQEQLKEELEDLQDLEPNSDTRNSRTRGGPVTTQRDKTREHFELLRRRRAGEKIPRVYSSDEDNEEEGDFQGTNINLIGQPDIDLSDQASTHSSVDTEPEAGLQEDLDEDDFIEDDTSGRRGRPHPDIPIEFTSFASAKPRELFPHIVEWLVKNKIAPAFSREDALFNLAFARVDDQVKAQAGSRLISSAWNATFKFTILARPQISITLLPGIDEDNIRTCDACNKTNRPARYDFLLTGDAYSQRTLEPIDNSDEEDKYEEIDRDEGGHALAPQGQHFYLGSHCAANAQMGHKLTHWKHHLNESVLAYLEEQGVLSAEAIVARDKMNSKKREKQAEVIVDSMEETGMIAELWKSFQNDLDDARLGMEDYSKRGRSYGRIGVIRSSGIDGTIREWRDNKFKETQALESESEDE